jgi:hypothetical protein
MATLRTRRFAEVDRLKTISPPQLVALLRPNAGYLAGRGVSLPNGRNDELDLVALSRVLMDPDETMPLPLVDALYLINKAATPEGMDGLVDAVRARGWSLEAGPTATPSDVAVEVWLRWPDLLQRKHAEILITRPRSFEYFVGTGMAGTPVPSSNTDRLAALEQRLDVWFSSNRRGRGCRVFRFDRADKIWLLIRHGLPVQREGAIHDGESQSVFFRPEKHDVVVYDGKRDELGINAGSRKEKELYREEVGDYLFGQSGYFAGNDKYTLDPLKRDGAAALVCSDVDGIDHVALTELEFVHGGPFRERVTRKASDVMAALAARGRHIPATARLSRGVFSVKFADGPRPRSVTLRLPNIAQYTRDEDSELVERWLMQRAFMAEPRSGIDALPAATLASA